MTPDLPAILFLVVVATAPAAMLERARRRTEFSRFQFFLYCVATLLVRLLWRARLPRRFPLVRGQGCVIVSNHRSSVDPFFIQIGLPWTVHWMVAREYCESRAFGWFLRAAEVIPTNRGGIDTAATKGAIRWAAQGDVVGMFPEGRINVTDEFLLPLRAGAVLVALKARVPILPCYISGSPYGGEVWRPFFLPARVRLCWGRPIDLSDYYDRPLEDGEAGELMRRCAREIARLAGRDDFEPKLAGKNWKTGGATLVEAER